MHIAEPAIEARVLHCGREQLLAKQKELARQGCVASIANMTSQIL